MKLEIIDAEAGRVLALFRKKNELRAQLNDAMEQDNGQAIEHWAKEMRVLNEQAGTLLFRAMEGIENGS